ncbi:hypothetical protein DFQ26_009208 [Actinomortierella ambigua]|nr:hypothetical protein DFQ26_009208 [Actinomortierella ambigua]
MGARSFDVTFQSVQSAEFLVYLWETVNTPTCQFAIFALIAHVANYNLTARFEYNTRGFTKLLGKNAIYFYAVYLLLSAYIRDQIIHKAVLFDVGSNGNTALHLAVLLGESSIVSALVERGADVNLRNRKGYSSVDMSDNPEILALLNIQSPEE